MKTNVEEIKNKLSEKEKKLIAIKRRLDERETELNQREKTLGNMLSLSHQQSDESQMSKFPSASTSTPSSLNDTFFYPQQATVPGTPSTTTPSSKDQSFLDLSTLFSPDSFVLQSSPFSPLKSPQTSTTIPFHTSPSMSHDPFFDVLNLSAMQDKQPQQEHPQQSQPQQQQPQQQSQDQVKEMHPTQQQDNLMETRLIESNEALAKISLENQQLKEKVDKITSIAQKQAEKIRLIVQESKKKEENKQIELQECMLQYQKSLTEIQSLQVQLEEKEKKQALEVTLEKTHENPEPSQVQVSISTPPSQKEIENFQQLVEASVLSPQLSTVVRKIIGKYDSFDTQIISNAIDTEDEEKMKYRHNHPDNLSVDPVTEIATLETLISTLREENELLAVQYSHTMSQLTLLSKSQETWFLQNLVPSEQ